MAMQSKVPGVKSIISKASNAKADLFIEPGDRICFGDLFLEVYGIAICLSKLQAFLSMIWDKPGDMYWGSSNMFVHMGKGS